MVTSHLRPRFVVLARAEDAKLSIPQMQGSFAIGLTLLMPYSVHTFSIRNMYRPHHFTHLSLYVVLTICLYSPLLCLFYWRYIQSNTAVRRHIRIIQSPYRHAREPLSGDRKLILSSILTS